jgi:hypothetical protein
MANKSANPKEIPVEPYYYKFLLKGVCDKKQKDSMQKAINKYNKICEEAYIQLIKDLKKSVKDK